jgi:U4/U6 small nuclear ribonucleoprotein PRP3
MRVFGNEAIQDPSKIEKEVRKQMAKRALDHIKHNEMNKLTDEQRREKKRKKLEENTAGSVQVAVFRVDDLSHPQRKFKVDMNAQQLNLTGVAILNPQQSLVVVEGGPKGIKAYKKLMLRRIDWADTTAPAKAASSSSSSSLPSSGVNRCLLVWEGITAHKAFKQFRFRLCQDEKEAKDALAIHKVEHYWELAKQTALQTPVV